VPKEEHGKTVWVLALEDGPAALADLIVLDEVSMVDEKMANDVRAFGKKILVMGDPAQLPPVGGAGAFIARDPDFFLTEIHRQAAESPILRIATMLRQGQMPEYGDYGQGVVVAKLNAETAQQVYREETQPIVAINRVRMTITQQIRRARGYEGALPLLGERVMCGRNNREMAIFNGGLGTLTADAKVLHDGKNIRFSVQMEDLARELKMLPVNRALFDMHFDQTIQKPEYLEKGIELFDWGFVLTAHKAQGSEYDDVSIVDDAGVFRGDQWKWRYTAATRASERMLFLRRQR
jgi:exodeoxyribonuclease-5